VETTFTEAEEFDHVGAGEPDRVGEASLKFPLVESDFHEGHIFVAISGRWQTKAWDAFNYGLGLYLLAVRAAEDLDNYSGNFAVGGGGKKTEGMEALFDPDEINVFNNKWRKRWVCVGH